jgi:hypothetical protein
VYSRGVRGTRQEGTSLHAALPVYKGGGNSAGACDHCTPTGVVDTTVVGCAPKSRAPSARSFTRNCTGMSWSTKEVRDKPVRGVPIWATMFTGRRPRLSATVSTAMYTCSEAVEGRTRRARRSASRACTVKKGTKVSMFKIGVHT